MGQQGFFECLPTNDTFPEPSVMWYKNGSSLDVDAQPSKYFVSPNTKTLLLSQVNTDDAGDYHCVLTNPAGNVNGSRQHLDVRSSVKESSNSDDDSNSGDNHISGKLVLYLNCNVGPVVHVTPL